ncbi:MAG TPA: hypothetical protein VLG76_08780 [Rhabdochlamydiaceae bacterium]|nr:hypothetical protein [Rhabdochlamydiaceae bacterium]
MEALLRPPALGIFEECGDLLAKVTHAKLKHVYLAHLSEECNSPELALKVVQEKLKNEAVKLSIAYQDKASHPIYF